MAALHTSRPSPSPSPSPPLCYRASAALHRHTCASRAAELLPSPLRSKLNPPLHGPPPSIFFFVSPHPSSMDSACSMRITASASRKNDSEYSLIREESALAEKDSPCSEDGRDFVANSYGDGKDLQIDTELPDVSGSFESLNNCTDLIDGDGRKLTWFQYGFINTVLPLIRVVNGSNLKELSLGNERKKKKNKKLQRSEAEDLRASWSFVKMLTGSWPPTYHRRKIRRRLRQAEADFFTFTSHVGKFLFTMMATGTVLATGYELAGGDSELETVIWLSWLAGIIVGSMVGAEKVMQKRFRSGPRNVIITGSTRGLGKALAREFLFAGDRVVIASRSPESVAETVEELQVELASRLYHPFPMVQDSLSLKDRKDGARVIGIACDVSKVNDVKALAEFAGSELGSIDLWINNAGINKGFRPLTQFSDDDIQEIVSANMIGSLICTREAIRVMKSQRRGGHIFNMDGAGSGGSSTPLTAVYGATKCGLRQLHGSLLKECKGSRVGIHTASPGMVLTDLLLSGASLQNKKMFNIICELPETVARTLVPRMRDIKGTGKAINFLTPPRILLALVTAWLRRGRWFDEEGRAVYAAEADRLRNWAEDRARLPVSAAIEQFSDTTLVSVFSITVICAFIILESGISGT